MKISAKRLLYITVFVGLLTFALGCTSTRTENGVTIEKKRSLNPLNYIPDIPKLSID